jgi:hypothetical protein
MITKATAMVTNLIDSPPQYVCANRTGSLIADKKDLHNSP